MDNRKLLAQVKTIQMVHRALMGAIVLMLSTGIVLVMQNPLPTDWNNPINYIPIVLMVAVFPMSGVMFNKLVTGAKEKVDLSDKLAAYQGAHLVRMALFESAGIMGFVTAVVTSSYFGLIFPAFIAVVFSITFPSGFKIEHELNLTPREREVLRS
jgi:hypothetical protein